MRSLEDIYVIGATLLAQTNIYKILMHQPRQLFDFFIIFDIVSNLVFWSQQMNELVVPLHINNICQQ